MIEKDEITTIGQLKEEVLHFVAERDWQRFHTPKNLAAKIAIEASELLEKFVWLDSAESLQEIDKNRLEIENELADVFTCVLAFCNVTHIDLTRALLTKLKEVKNKYPIEKSKGIATKYTKL